MAGEPTHEDVGKFAERPDTASTEQAVPSIADSLEAAFDEMESAAKGTEAAPEGEAKADPEPDSEQQEAAPEDEANPEADPDPEADTEAEPAAAVQTPEHWSAEDKEFLEALPDDKARERVLDWRKSIERGAQEKFEEAAAIRKEYGEIDQLVKPYEQELSLQGMTKMDAVRRLFAAHDLLRKDTGGGLEWLAQDYGRQVAGTGQAQDIVRRVASALKVDIGGQAGQADASDPQAQRFTALERQIEDLKREREESQRSQQQQAISGFQAQIQEFADAKDESGNPKHPHFEAVRQDMKVALQVADESGQKMTLDEAYDRAVWARPDIRDGLLKARQDAEAKKTAETRKQAVEKAKAARTPRSTSVPSKPAAEDLPIPDAIEKAWDEAGLGA